MRDLSHDRFVAHIDILGISAMVEKDHDEAWQMLSALVDARESAENTTLEFLDRAERIHVPETVRSVTFSDTIILFTRGASDNDLRALIVTVTQIFNKAIYNCVPVRAGISLGTFYVNFEKSMYAGPALIDAYRTGESAQWIGIVFSKSLQGREQFLELRRGNSNVVVDWQVPQKQGSAKFSVVNWPATMARNLKVMPPFSTTQFYEIFESTFGPMSQLSEDIIRKYSNTVEFINAQFATHKP